LPLVLAGFLPLEERAKPLGFSIGSDQGIVDGDQLSISFPRPRASVAEESPGPTLDLDQEETLWRKDNSVNFVNTSIISDELEVGPSPVGFMRRKLLPHEFQGVPLPGKL
jgi:hypothetical protein